MMSLTTHAEKVQFLTSYLNGTLQTADEGKPLMILGSGANGKTYVFQEVVKTSPVNILLFMEGRHTFYPSTIPSQECKILILANGSSYDYALAEVLNAMIVEFKKDPAYI